MPRLSGRRPRIEYRPETGTWLVEDATIRFTDRGDKVCSCSVALPGGHCSHMLLLSAYQRGFMFRSEPCPFAKGSEAALAWQLGVLAACAEGSRS